MTDGQLIGLLNPMISMIFALTFLVFWAHDKKRKYILAIAVSYLLMGMGFLFAMFTQDIWILLKSVVSNSFYYLATVALMWAVGNRAKVRVPIYLLVAIGGASVLLNAWLKVSYESMNASLYSTNFAIGIMFGIGAWMLRKNAKKGGVERLLFWAILLVAVQFWVRPIISLSIETSINAEEYKSSFYWTMLNFSTAIFSVLVALSLIAACASDVMAQIREISTTDALTGLKIRRAFDEDAAKMIEKLGRTPLPLGMVIADIDNFKQVNDTYGHPCGDAVISAFGELIRSAARGSDLTGRIGGEEFCVMLWNADETGSTLFAEGLRSVFSTLTVDGLPEGLTFTASFGVVTHRPGESLEDMYARADVALYRAKNEGRNCVRVDKSEPGRNLKMA